MSNQQTRRPIQLSIVRAPGAPQPAVFRAPELFTAEQSEQITRLIAGAKLRGVVIGALIGPASWDLRPVVLDRGRTVVLRFSDPELMNDSVRQSSLEGYLARLSDLRGIDGFASSGVMKGRVWYLRPYFPKILSDGFEHSVQLEADGRRVFVQALIKQLATLHTAGLIHGHVCASNVGIEANVPSLLDFGIGAIQRVALVKTVDAVNEDTRALAEIINLIFDGAVPPEVRQLLEKLLSSEVWDRPSLEQLQQAFDPRSANSSRGPQSGKIIEATAAPQFQPPAIRLEATDEIKDKANAVADSRVTRPNVDANSIDKAADALTSAAMTQTVSSQTKSFDLLLIVLAAALLSFALARGYIPIPSFTGSSVASSELESRWFSAQPSQMVEVARLAALKGDAAAQAVVVKSALNDTALPGVRSDLIKIAYDPRWEQELTSADRKFVLSLALAGLLKSELPALDTLAERHPGVVLAIAATLPLTSSTPELEQIATQTLARLPNPIGSSFEIISKSGATELSSSTARAFAVIAVGGHNAAAVRALFPDNLEMLAALLRISAVLPLCKQRPDLASMVRQAAASNPSLEPALRSWFNDDDFGVWKGVNDALVLSIAAGNVTGQQLVFQQLVDLVSYPLRSTREAAIAEIGRTTVDESVLRVLEYISHDGSGLSRSSILSLMTLLQVPGEQARSFVLRWFSQKPSTKGVLGVLLARSRVAQGDFFNFEAARYLDRVEDLKPSIAELTALSMHTEVQARALAYGRLSISVPAERALLQAALGRESNEKLKKLLSERLGS